MFSVKASLTDIKEDKRNAFPIYRSMSGLFTNNEYVPDFPEMEVSLTERCKKKTMPQLRKRKIKETIVEEVGKKIRDENITIPKNVSKKKRATDIKKSTVKKGSSSVKRKKSGSTASSGDDEFEEVQSKDKKVVELPRKDSKIEPFCNELDGTQSKNKKVHQPSNHDLQIKQFDKTPSKSKKIVQSSNKKQKLTAKDKKASIAVKDEGSVPLDVKNESSDSENLLNLNDSGISSESVTDSVKIESQTVEPSVESQTVEPSTSFANDVKHEDESSSSESEWEEVEDQCETASLDDYKPDIPKEGVEITIDCPDLKIRKRKKKQFDENEWIRLHINRIRKDIQLSIHKTHLLCLIAHGMYVNKILNSESVRAIALSLISSDILSLTAGKKIDKIDVGGVEKLVAWFCDVFSFENDKCLFLNFFSSMVRSFRNKKAMNASEYNLMFVVIARILGFKVRLCVSLYPVTHKASNLIKKPNSTRTSKKSLAVKEEKETKTESETNEKKTKVKKKEEQKIKKTPKGKSTDKNAKKIPKENATKISRPRRSAGKSYKLSSDEDDEKNDDKDFEVIDGEPSDDDFVKTPKVNSKLKRTSLKKRNRKVLSSDSEPSSPQLSAFEAGNIVCWTEIYLKQEKQWVSVECTRNIVNRPYNIEEIVLKPVSYILAYDNDSYVKDVTRRYCNNYMTTNIKLRIDSEWWEETLDPFLPPNSMQNKAEEKKLDEMLVNKPLPTTVQGFKNHPLYALKRHLLKFEAIYPPDAPPVGFLRSEPVYARDCVHQLHSRETWLKEARVVKIGEEPYKIVKARPKWDRIAGVMRTDLPLEIFGYWQTKQYEPPTAMNGKVPRNEYGNVELFKSCMLPKGTVHLQLPGLNRVAKKLGIDCSPAVVGFDGHKGSVHPVFEGFVVCKEFKDTLIAAWDEEQENARKREEEKREKRIYGNWKKLIRGLLIRERIKLKYDTK